ncbi:hypothetical protein HK16_01750 [Acetobacter senegalensis]|uniref:Uncharacterized protein n=1 Tax=Acetobacter senegalensis TaxID=446692 RepID=A0A252EE49_9PROT|nr:hypothetical protein HK16_01750 [Acetobacter senegalensis]
MTRETEEMASIMDEFMYHVTGDEGRRTLFRTNEIKQQGEQERSESSPRQQGLHRDWRCCGNRRKSAGW